jgi:hypothetical protein
MTVERHLRGRYALRTVDFWNDDGSVDHARSGVYEYDVKVRD